MVVAVSLNSILLRSRTILGSTATRSCCHTHHRAQNAITNAISSTTNQSFYSSTSTEQQLQAQLNSSHVQLHPGITFASLQQQNHMWMTPVRIKMNVNEMDTHPIDSTQI